MKYERSELGEEIEERTPRAWEKTVLGYGPKVIDGLIKK